MAYQNKHLNTHSQKCTSCEAMPIVPNEIDMRYIDNTKEGGKEALEKAVSKIDISRPGPVPTVPEPNVEETMADIAREKEVGDVAKLHTKKKPASPKVKPQRKNHRLLEHNNKYSQEQRDLFERLYLQHKRKWSAATYAEKVHVTRETIYSWTHILNTKKTLKYCNRSVYQEILTVEELRYLGDEIIPENNMITQEQMAEKLHAAFPDLPIVSTSTICRYLKSPLMEEACGRDYSLKVTSQRGPNANSDSNKALRIERVSQLYQLIGKGYLWVSIDETHWVTNSMRTRGWSKVGEKAFSTEISQRTPFSCLTSIDYSGKVTCCDVVKGPVDADIFTAFFKQVLERYKSETCVFFMDNCAIHKKDVLQDMCGEAKQVVLFNAPYTQEVNPIEFFFSIWKYQISKEMFHFPGLDKFLDYLKTSVQAIDHSTIRAIFTHVERQVFPLVMAKKDL